MSGVGKVGGSLIPQNQPKVTNNQTKGLSAADAALNAAKMTALMDAGRMATAGFTAGGAGGLAGGFSVLSGATSADGVAFSQTAFSIGVLGVQNRSEGGAADTLNAFNVSPNDVHAFNTEAGKSFLALSGKKQESALSTMQQQMTVAQEATKHLEETGLQQLKLAVKSAMSEAAQKAEEGKETQDAEGVLQLNGEGGKVFGEVTEAIAKQPDLSNMPIEDAVALLFMMISEDAAKDTKQLLVEMDGTRLQRASLRKAEQLLNEEKIRLKDEARKSWDKLPTPKEEFDTWLQSQPVKMPLIETDYRTGEAKIIQSGNFGGPSVVSDAGGTSQIAERTPLAEPPATVGDSDASIGAYYGIPESAVADLRAVHAASGDAEPFSSWFDDMEKVGSTTDFATSDANKAKVLEDLESRYASASDGSARTVIETAMYHFQPAGAKKLAAPPADATVTGAATNAHIAAFYGLTEPEVAAMRDTWTKSGEAGDFAELFEGCNKIGNPWDNATANANRDALQAKMEGWTSGSGDLGSSAQNSLNTLNEAEAEFGTPGEAVQDQVTEGASEGQNVEDQSVEGAEGQVGSSDPNVDSFGGGATTFGGMQGEIDSCRDRRDSLSELSESQQLKMQIYTDRMAKAQSACSNLVKKLSDNLNQIIQNMK